MRVISGKFKGKSIKFLKIKNTRPLKDSVRENIFNILAHSNLISINIEKSKVLDAYSGFGSFGIECISRGANRVTFVENNIRTFKILKENLKSLKTTNQSNLINENITAFIKENLNHKYNILFFDPPYLDNNYLLNLRLIKEKKFFFKDHIIVLHREISSSDNYDDILNVLMTKEYGRSKLIFAKFN
tara:strand:- start:174 stop:734 length:561 start_codon:yes stop_codon:yes gene_type:complete